MNFSSQFDHLGTRVTEARAAAEAAVAGSREQLRQRIDRAQSDLDVAAERARQGAGEGASEARAGGRR